MFAKITNDVLDNETLKIIKNGLGKRFHITLDNDFEFQKVIFNGIEQWIGMTALEEYVVYVPKDNCVSIYTEHTYLHLSTGVTYQIGD